MSARVSLCLSKCSDDGRYANYDEAYRALRQHGDHVYGCTQFVAAEAFMQGSRNVA
ncbi:hypothetical protein ACIBG0_39125 [Nocardia sp. NPDC050630]|uniref:hypothetical protein n=1 Tax=Nocardia sp. NPDC050630 TaxID=3364321 RepID=UPI0037A5BE88